MTEGAVSWGIILRNATFAVSAFTAAENLVTEALGGPGLMGWYGLPFSSLGVKTFYNQLWALCCVSWSFLERSVFIPIPKKGNAEECSNYRTIALISQASKVMLKFLQARLQQYVNHEIPDVQAGFKNGRGTRDQIANIRWIIEKSREFQKNIYFCFIDYAKAFDCVDHNKLWKILKEMGIPDHLTCLWRNLYAGQEATARTGHGTRLVPYRKRSTSRLYIVTLLI